MWNERTKFINILVIQLHYLFFRVCSLYCCVVCRLYQMKFSYFEEWQLVTHLSNQRGKRVSGGPLLRLEISIFICWETNNVKWKTKSAITIGSVGNQAYFERWLIGGRLTAKQRNGSCGNAMKCNAKNKATPKAGRQHNLETATSSHLIACSSSQLVTLYKPI